MGVIFQHPYPIRLSQLWNKAADHNVLSWMKQIVRMHGQPCIVTADHPAYRQSPVEKASSFIARVTSHGRTLLETQTHKDTRNDEKKNRACLNVLFVDVNIGLHMRDTMKESEN